MCVARCLEGQRILHSDDTAGQTKRVKYDTPLELGVSNASQQMVSNDKDQLLTSIKAQMNKKVEIPYAGTKPSPDDILHSILPPREWIEDNKHYIQYVSNQPATRLDVVKLQESLDYKLLERQAREVGICPVREELYSQCFDDIIRQVTLESPERGLLLLKVRNEAITSIAAYKTLFESSIVFGTRKQIQSEVGKTETDNLITELEEKKRDLDGQLVYLTNKLEAIEKKETYKLQVARAKRHEELEYLRQQVVHLENFLRSVESA